MDQEHRDYAEPGNVRRSPPLWILVLAVVVAISAFLVIFFGDLVDGWLGDLHLRKVRD